MRIGLVGYFERAADTMQLARQPGIVFCLLEVGQDIAIAPTRAAKVVLPTIVVNWRSTHVDLSVDRTSAAQYASLCKWCYDVILVTLFGRLEPPGKLRPRRLVVG